MKIPYWNIHYAKITQPLAELLFIKEVLKPDFMFVAETLTSDINSNRIIRSFGFSSHLIVAG